jgi:hypothetical protein
MCVYLYVYIHKIGFVDEPQKLNDGSGKRYILEYEMGHVKAPLKFNDGSRKMIDAGCI